MLVSDCRAKKQALHFVIYFLLIVAHNTDAGLDLRFEVVGDETNYETTLCIVALGLN